MNKLKLLATLLLTLSGAIRASGQSVDGGAFAKLPGFSDNVVPPSPAAAAITKYVDFPVTHSLGLADISIPLYTIKTRELELPLTLSYHASGIKVDDEPSSMGVGLGWNINGIGVVTKEVRGLPDDQVWHHCILPRGPINDNNSSDYIIYAGDVINNRADSFYDLFTYSLGDGRGGSFLVAADINNVNEHPSGIKVKKLSQTDDIIEFYRDSDSIDDYPYLIKSFKITDPKGDAYYFESVETVSVANDPPVYSTIIGGPEDTSYINSSSSWYLTRIESADETESIIFEYKDVYDYARSTTLWTKSWMERISKVVNPVTFGEVVASKIEQLPIESQYYVPVNKDSDGRHIAKNFIRTWTYSNRKQLSRIYFNYKGIVPHLYTDDGPILGKYDTTGCHVIEFGHGEYGQDMTMVVRDFNGNQIKKVAFGMGDNRLLSTVTLKGTDDKEFDKYSFEYYRDSLGNRPTLNQYAKDRFGYYNGQDDAKDDTFINPFGADLYSYGADPADRWPFKYDVVTAVREEGLTYWYDVEDRNPIPSHYIQLPYLEHIAKDTVELRKPEKFKRTYSFEHAVLRSLRSITKASGEKTEFIYGPSFHVDSIPSGPYSDSLKAIRTDIGIRIDTIKTYDSDDRLSRIRTFNYENSGCTIDFSKVSDGHYVTLQSESKLVEGTVLYNGYYPMFCLLTVSSNATLAGKPIEQARVFYEKVTETVWDPQTPDGSNKIETEYLYDCSESIHRGVGGLLFDQSSTSDQYGVQATAAPTSEDDPVFSYPGDRYKHIFQWVNKNAAGAMGPSLWNVGDYFVESPPAFNNMTRRTVKRYENGRPIIVEQEHNTYRKFAKDDMTERFSVGMNVLNNMSEIFYKWASTGTYMDAGEQRDRIDNIKFENLEEDCHLIDIKQKINTSRLVRSSKSTYDYPNGYDEEPISKFSSTDYNYENVTPAINWVVRNYAPESPMGDGDDSETDPSSGDGGDSGDTSDGSGDSEAGDDGSQTGFAPTGSDDYGTLPPDFEWPGIDPGDIIDIGGLGALEPKTIYETELRNVVTLDLKSTTHYVDGDVYERKLIKPYMFSDDSVIKNMIDRNNIYEVLGEEVTKNDSGVDAVYSRYKLYNGGPLHHQVARPYLTMKLKDNIPVSSSRVHDYDKYGNVASVSENGEPPTCYIWGYRGMYPVAEIRNASYDEVVTELTQDSIDAILSGKGLSDSDIAALNGLRSALPEAMVTTYVYRSLVGISSVTDPSGRTTTYTYDPAGRLACVMDDDGNKVESYEYYNIN